MGYVSRFAILLLVLGVGVSMPPATAQAAASPTFYVDGKHGSDSNSGTSLGSAVKTLAAGMDLVRYSGRLEVVGYEDYIYYEPATRSYWVGASESYPAVIEAYGYGTPAYVRPIISGAIVVNRPGSTRWYRPNASSYPDVWATSWTTAIPGYESNVKSYRQEAVFMDVSQPLVRPAVTPTLAQLQAQPASQYWNGSTLYVHLGLWSGTLADSNPNNHTIEIPKYNGLLISSGSQYVTVQGFRVRHASIGLGGTGTSHHITFKDCDGSYNYPMGFFSAGAYQSFLNVTGTRNTIQLIKMDNGANHNLVDNAVATENMGQGIKLTGASTAYNTISNSTFADTQLVPSWARGYGGYTQGIDIEEGAHDNLVTNNLISNNVRGLMLYQNSSSGAPLNNNVVTGNRFTGNRFGVLIWDGRLSTSGSTGNVTFSKNLYYGNVEAVGCDAVTSNKLFDHETIYDTGTGPNVESNAFHIRGGVVTVRNTIISDVGGYGFFTQNGSKVDVLATTVVNAGLGVYSGDVTWLTPPVKTTYVALAPVRIVDTRLGLGITSPLVNGKPRTFQVAGVKGIPSNALSVTGNVTITHPSSVGYVALTVAATSKPSTSTINFSAKDTRANGVIAPLASNGTMAAVFIGKGSATTQFIVDITGYYVADGGATYVPVPTERILDTRAEDSLTPILEHKVPATFQVSGLGGVPENAIAVTGNVTVTGQERGGYVALTDEPTAEPKTSTINFPVGDNRANGVTMPLGTGGTISATYVSAPGKHVHLIFDVTGYYVAGSSGLVYAPLPPGRLVDTRLGLGIPSALAHKVPGTTQITGRYAVPTSAVAISGNVTVTRETSLGYVALTDEPVAQPTTSTINFPAGDTRANGFTARLSTGTGKLSATFVGRSGATTALIIDVTGYFLPPGGALGPSDYEIDPEFLSTDPESPLFLTIGPSSPVYSLGTDGSPLGARWTT
jgi:hypothetical protein